MLIPSVSVDDDFRSKIADRRAGLYKKYDEDEEEPDYVGWGESKK
jgi:hypothetical protein